MSVRFRLLARAHTEASGERRSARMRLIEFCSDDRVWFMWDGHLNPRNCTQAQ